LHGEAGERAQQVADGDWFVSIEVQPIGKGIDMIGGKPGAKSPLSDR
jgi:hypothetical protein